MQWGVAPVLPAVSVVEELGVVVHEACISSLPCVESIGARRSPALVAAAGCPQKPVQTLLHALNSRPGAYVLGLQGQVEQVRGRALVSVLSRVVAWDFSVGDRFAK